MIAQRYERNIGTITEEENEKLQACSVWVAGCGGLGGYIIEGLARIGVGSITAIDGDVFQPSNLNQMCIIDRFYTARHKTDFLHGSRPRFRNHPCTEGAQQERHPGSL